MKNALVLGASRGIGRQIAVTLARNGYQVGVASKTTEQSEKLPGTIYDVCKEIESTGGQAIPLKCNVRLEADIRNAVQQCISTFGHLDCVVYNAGAILWERVDVTPLKRYELMHDVNVRGAYCTIQEVLPHMMQRKHGRILLNSPPIYNRFFKGKTPYAITKVGMTVLVHGLANELKGSGVSVSALWPATTIQSFVTEVKGAPPAIMRTADIYADATLRILDEPSERYNGKALIDEDMLRDLGVTDFTKYRCDPDGEPIRMMPKKFPSLLVEEEDAALPKL